MKTTMQELREELQESINGLPETLKGINDPFVRKTVTDAVLIVYKCVLKRIGDEFLEKEKQQIITAYNAFDHDMTANEYYNEKFY